MPADTTVKYIHSGMTGAPTLNNAASSFINLLDAVLKDGFGLGTVDSVVIASNIATVTRAAGHPFELNSVALIAGATVTGGSINGEQRILSVTSTTYTFATTGLANQSATGTITHKVAPLGWLKPFSGTNLAAYKSADPTATQCLLRVDDQLTTNARVVGYETMSDINTGVNPFPSAAQQSGGLFWGKSNGAGTRSWIIWGDGKFFYFYCRTYNGVAATNGSSTTAGIMHYFGDPIPEYTADVYHCTITGMSADNTSSGGTIAGCATFSTTTVGVNNGGYMARNYTQQGTSRGVGRVSPGSAAGNYSGQATQTYAGVAISYPNPTNFGLILLPTVVCHDNTIRATLPGFYYSPQSLINFFAGQDVIVGTTYLPGRRIMAIASGPPSSSAIAISFMDTTGPWR